MQRMGGYLLWNNISLVENNGVNEECWKALKNIEMVRIVELVKSKEREIEWGMTSALKSEWVTKRFLVAWFTEKVLGSA